MAAQPQSTLSNSGKPQGLYEKLEERILDRDQKGASDVYYDLVRAGRPVLFTKCSLLVQELLKAKRDLELKELLRELSGWKRDAPQLTAGGRIPDLDSAFSRESAAPARSWSAGQH